MSQLVFPQVDVYPSNQTVPEGKTTNISCKAKGVPKPNLSWSLEGDALPPVAVENTTLGESLLRLPKTEKGMEGTYQCTAQSKAGEATSKSTLRVLG